MRDGFIKVAAASPQIKVADTAYNADACIEIANKAFESGVKVLVFPELVLTGYSCGDLFLNDLLLNGAIEGLKKYVYSTAMLDMVSIIGLPVMFCDKVYNCAAVVSGGQLLGIIPKKHLPDYANHNEVRYFTPASDENFAYSFDDNVVILGTRQMFVCREMPLLKIGVEICEDLLNADAPSNKLTAAGATVIANPSASAEIIGNESNRRMNVLVQSSKTASGYIYSNLGLGESTANAVFSGHSMVAECGDMIAERKPFDFDGGELLITELDLQKIVRQRRINNAYNKNTYGAEFSEIEFDLCIEDTDVTRFIDPRPFIPSDKSELFSRCETILEIQSRGLAKRIETSYSKKIVVGISGGLDSCLAILVMAKAMDILKRPRTDIIAITMPCFGTTSRTKNNAEILCERLGVEFRCVDIFDAVKQHFKDIGHDDSIHNVVYENAQARERTQILMDIANAEGGIVVGTGDLSELALGWATYNGDHMSMYGVNASIPKTLIRHVVSHCAEISQSNGDTKMADALRDILDTPVSPELLPANDNGEIAQKTEDLVGPYELHDFYIYNFIKNGFSPKKLFRLASIAFAEDYDDKTLIKWLEVFIKRFFAQQFKRSCLPEGPKVGSVALDPVDYKMPSDVTSSLWLAEINDLKNELLGEF